MELNKLEREIADRFSNFAVTPCVGVWIEISYIEAINNGYYPSLPAWECGLKYCIKSVLSISIMSLPAWECGLKYYTLLLKPNLLPSLPAWECGLKLLHRKIELKI